MVKILIIEDRKDFSDMAAYYIKSIWNDTADITIISNNYDFYDCLHQDWKLIVTDGHIGDMNVNEVVKNLRLHCKKHIPILLMTTDPELLQEFSSNKFLYCDIAMVQKPCSQGEFQIAISDLIGDEVL